MKSKRRPDPNASPIVLALCVFAWASGAVPASAADAITHWNDDAASEAVSRRLPRFLPAPAHTTAPFQGSFAVALILPWLTFTVNAQIPRDWQVRSSYPYLTSLLAEGYRKSGTFRSLVVRLNESDVVVYVEPHLTMQSTRRGYLTSDVVIGGGTRYLRIRVNPRGRTNTVIALLAHELQHALEVADAPAVRDEFTFEKHFALIDSGTCRGACYETIAARKTELAVAKELRAR